MTSLILPSAHDGRISIFLAEQLGILFHPPFTMMGLEQNGEIVAGALFNTYTRNDIHVTIAGHGWTRRFLREMGLYLFEQLGVDRFTAITEKQNVIDIVERIGGQREGVIRNHFGPGRNGILLGVLRDEYRYKHGPHTIGPERNADSGSAGGVQPEYC